MQKIFDQLNFSGLYKIDINQLFEIIKDIMAEEWVWISSKSMTEFVYYI